MSGERAEGAPYDWASETVNQSPTCNACGFPQDSARHAAAHKHAMGWPHRRPWREMLREAEAIDAARAAGTSRPALSGDAAHVESSTSGPERAT